MGELISAEYKYILGDSLKALKKFEDNKFKLVMTSPPYNVGKEYEVRKSIESYLKEQDEIIKEIVRTLHPSGSICWQVGNFIKDGECDFQRGHRLSPGHTRRASRTNTIEELFYFKTQRLGFGCP